MKTPKANPAILQFLRDIGRKGGMTTAARMTPGARSARARKAVAAREAKRVYKKKKDGR